MSLHDAGFNLTPYDNTVHYVELTNNISRRWGIIYREEIAKISAAYGYIQTLPPQFASKFQAIEEQGGHDNPEESFAKNKIFAAGKQIHTIQVDYNKPS